MTDTQVDPLLPVDPNEVASPGFGPAFVLDTSEDVEPPDEGPKVEDDLPDSVREDFVGLMHLGHLEDECEVAGHRFLLRTPSQADRLDMGFVHKPYLNTMSTESAWKLVFVSAYLRRIDSVPAPESLNTSISGLRTRFDWVSRSIASHIVIGMLFDECMALAARERECVEYLDRLGEPSA